MELEFNPFASEEITQPFSEEWEAKRRVASAVKKLTETLVTSSPTIEQMHGIAEQLEATADEFSRTPRIFGRLGWIETGEHGNFGQVSHELNALAGLSNPLAPPVKNWVDDGVPRGSCYCGWAYEGPPGSVHGGYVAAIFDQFLGFAQAIGGRPGMTAYLNVTYHQRTPLNTRLEMIAEMLGQEGRKTHMRAEMRAEGQVTATCEALFVQPRQGMYALKNLEAAERGGRD